MRDVIVLLLACGSPAIGQTPVLEALRAVLIPARAHPLEHVETRGATSELTLVKHNLRDWVESRLTPLTRQDEEIALAFQLNAEIRKAGLACDYQPAANQALCPDQSLIGFLGDIKLRRTGGFLVV